MARLRLLRVPQLLVAAGVLAALATGADRGIGDHDSRSTPCWSVCCSSNFVLLGSSRLGACIRQVAAQGALLGAAHARRPRRIGRRRGASGCSRSAAAAVKAVVFPLLAAPRAARGGRPARGGAVRRLHRLDPASASLALAALALARPRACRCPRPVASPLLVPVALFTMLVGLFLIVSRRKALTQVVGYLVAGERHLHLRPGACPRTRRSRSRWASCSTSSSPSSSWASRSTTSAASSTTSTPTG